MAQDRLSLVATDADPLAYWHCVSNTRAKSKFMRKCEIQCHFKNSYLKESFAATNDKAALRGYLFTRWAQQKVSGAFEGEWKLHLTGWFCCGREWIGINTKRSRCKNYFALHLQHAELTNHSDSSKCKWHRCHCPVHVQSSDAAVSTAGTENGNWTWQAPANTLYWTTPWTITMWINALHLYNL